MSSPCWPIGYNFDGMQTPLVARYRDPAFDAPQSVFSVPSFYGAHGHNPNIPSMSASFIAAGPGHRARRGAQRQQHRRCADHHAPPRRAAGPDVDGEMLRRILD